MTGTYLFTELLTTLDECVFLDIILSMLFYFKSV